MTITGLIKGESYDKKVLRREKTSNGFETTEDKAAVIEDSDTGEQQLKFQSDGTTIPKPENQYFETLWYRNFLDKIFRSKSHTDFVEIYLEDDENGNGDFVSFDPDNSDLETTGNESQFQTHRDIEAEKTLEIYSEEGNQEWYFLAGLGVITMINLGGMYVIVNGLDSAVIEGVKQGFQTVQSQGQAVQGATQGVILLGLGTSMMMENLKNKAMFWK